MMKLIQRLLVAGGLAYVALTGTPSPNCSSGSRVVDEAVRPNAMYANEAKGRLHTPMQHAS